MQNPGTPCLHFVFVRLLSIESLEIIKVQQTGTIVPTCPMCVCWESQGGAAVLSLQGPLRVEGIVAQGCRPLTDSIWLVDKCENNIILQVCFVGTGDQLLAAGRRLYTLPALQCSFTMQELAVQNSRLQACMAIIFDPILSGLMSKHALQGVWPSFHICILATLLEQIQCSRSCSSLLVLSSLVVFR